MNLQRVALSFQRLLASLPPSLRNAARKLASRGRAANVRLPIDDWSKPLLFGTSPPASPDDCSSTLPIATTPTSVPADVHSDARCAIITGALDVGGLDEVVGFLAQGLRELGFTTAVMHAVENERQPGRIASRLMEAGVEVVARSSEEGIRWLRDWSPDVVSVHGAPEWCISAAVELQVPVVEVLHGMHDFFEIDYQDVLRRSSMLTRIVAVSDLVRLQYLRINPKYGAERVVTIPNGFDSTRFAPVPRQLARAKLGLNDQYLFLSLARLCLQKNSYGLAAAFSDVAERRSDVHLVLAGQPETGRYPFQVSHLKQTMRFGDRLHLRDHSSQPAILLAAADGFVLDSFFEGWALATMEALAAGLPVVISDVGGAREQLAERPERGVLVDNPLGDPLAVSWDRISAARFKTQVNRSQLTDAMVHLVDNRAEFCFMRSEIARIALEDFDARHCLAQHADALRSALDERRSPRDPT